MKILINNQWASYENAKVSVFSEALMYGFGLFETLRTNQNKHPVFTEEHITRLFHGCQQIDLPVHYAQKEIVDMVDRIAAESTHLIQRIKVLVIPDTVIITSVPLNLDISVYDGVHLQSTPLTRALPEIKSTAYLDCYLSWKNASQNGYYDALFTDTNGFVSEASRSNIVWNKAGAYGSRLEDVLPGITIRMLKEKIKLPIQNEKITLDQLQNKTSVFLSNSIIGIVPVLSIDKVIINRGIITQKVKTITDQYQQLTSTHLTV